MNVHKTNPTTRSRATSSAARPLKRTGFKPIGEAPWTCETEHEVKPKPVSGHPESWMADLSAALKEAATQAMNARHDVPLIVPVLTFAPAKIEPTKNIYVVVQPTDGEYVATLFDANLAMTGDTQEEAVANLKELIIDVFESLEADETILAPGMANQLAVLRSLLKKQP